MSILSCGPERQHRQARQEHERLHHIELRGLGVTAVAQNDAGTEDRDRHYRGAAARIMCSENFLVRA